ncbi:MAG: hypothetical protein M3O90_03325 [Actinomycetota bacterium]|nr:hypothetical protein [Actinomycetota bacterium]
MPRLARLPVLCMLAAAAIAALAGCANKIETRTLGETEGIYIDVGELKYQVQLSRILNADDTEDGTYFQGLPAGEAATAEQAWFAIFLRVQNTTDRTLAPANEFEIVDTQEKSFTPQQLQGNPFAYKPVTLPPKAIIPAADSIAGEGVIQGALLLFKVDIASLQNRPLEFRIRSVQNPDEVGIVDLDV